MLNALYQWLFDSAGLTAHGFCLLWEPGLIWTYALSDAGVGIAYFSIPLALAVLAHRRADLVFRPLLWLFAAFILLCGTTHFLDLLTLWVPVYGLTAVIKAATAIVSIFTAVMLWRLMPIALALPSPAQFREANAALAASRQQLSQAQKMEAVGQLTGGIAHDFNNIMQTITASLSLIERRLADGRVEEVDRYLNAMRKASDNASRLSNRLLAFSRKQALEPRPIEVDRLIGGLEELLRRSLGNSVRLKLSLSKSRWNVLCDPNQLENSLVNLAINARDAMPKGGSLAIGMADRELTAADLSEADDSQPGNYVEITVADTGIGMTPEIMAQVLEPFFTTKPAGHGTGLGMSQVYGFVKESGGFLRLDSVPGAGTSIRLYLPGCEREPEPSPELAGKDSS